jgi:type II secretion system protein G
MKHKKGFTLIELLVVVAIMGLLSAMAIVSLNNARARARDARRLADIKQMQTALELYFLDTYAYPADPANTVLDGKCLSDNGIEAVCSGNITYMASLPDNPQPRTDGGCDNTSYTYKVDAGGGTRLSYHILYCLGHATGDLAAGQHYATPAGLAEP